MNDRRGVGLVLTGLGLVDTAAGDFRNADARLAEARELFRRAGDRWGLTGALWRTADLAFAQGRVDDAQAALVEAHAVVRETGRDRWIAHTLSGLAEVAVLKGEREQAKTLFTEARDRYTAKHDLAGVADVEKRLRGIAHMSLSPRKGHSSTNASRPRTPRRQP